MNNAGCNREIGDNLYLNEDARKFEETYGNEVSLSSDCFPQSNAYNAQNPQSSVDRNNETMISGLLKSAADVIYEGGLEDKEEVEYKVLLEETNNNNIIRNDGGDVEIDVRGIKYKIPYAVECHLCNEMMNLCVRRTRYRGQNREYAAYRCNRKGCQTFRSIRKVFSNSSELRKAAKMESSNVLEPSLTHSPQSLANQSMQYGEYSEDDSDDLVIQRVYLPKLDNQDNEHKPLSVTDRMRKANQERATVFSEFADQLRRDIAANKRVRVRKQAPEKEEQQGTLFYISKELSPQEIIELQDIIIKALISLRKLPPPMTMHDLPVFANCPYSKNELEAGRKDDTLIYRDPKPYEVPDILQQNSPRKQADDIINYHRRKEQQDAKRMERRHVEKRYRSWASLKREFDMAETGERPSSKMSKTSYDDSNPDQQPNHVTFQQLISKIGDRKVGQLSCRIRASNSEQSNESLQWIDLNSPTGHGITELSQDGNTEKYPEQELNEIQMDDRIDTESKLKKTISTPLTLRHPISPLTPLMRSFSSINSGTPKTPLGLHSSMFFPDHPFLTANHQLSGSTFYPFSPLFPQYQLAPSSDSVFSNRDSNGEHYQCVGASEVVRTEPTINSPFTYVHPDSGVRLTDPSAFLTTFIPSPITKFAPVNFSEEISRPRRSSEPSTSTAHMTDCSEQSTEKYDCEEDTKEVLDKADDPKTE
uniref:Uncharacterized protein n=1 Tax=Caenorhabditis tropicalis TaxID=1561998 RepID=A0A1I7UAA6_9PELO